MIEAGRFQTKGAACWTDIPAPGGDLLPSAVVTIDDDGTGIWYVVATRRRGNPADLEWSCRASSLRTFPPANRTAPSHESPGEYRAFVSAAGEGTVHLTKGERENKPVNVATDTPLWHDLGLFQVNGGRGPVQHDPRTIGEFPVAPVPLGVRHEAGVKLGEVVFLPTGTEHATIRTRPAGASRLVLDGVNRATYRMDTNGALLPSGGAMHYGGLPVLGIRGQVTRLFVLAGIAHPDGTGIPATKPIGVAVTYRENFRDVGQFAGGAPEPDRP